MAEGREIGKHVGTRASSVGNGMEENDKAQISCGPESACQVYKTLWKQRF